MQMKTMEASLTMVNSKIQFDFKSCIGCKQCLENCPLEAVVLDCNGHIQTIDEGICGKCGMCADNCPKNVIKFNNKDGSKW